MSRDLPVTVILAVKNEAVNLSRCLAALSPALRVVVVDSQSSDETEAIALEHGAEIVQFHYDGAYPKKRQWALENLELTTEWVFMLDADEVVPEPLWKEITEVVISPSAQNAYFITKGFHFMGRRFRFGGFSHSAVLLFRAGRGRFEELDNSVQTACDMEIHERIIVEGPVGRLHTPLIHEDFKGLTAYIDRHNQYSSWEAGVRYRNLSTRAYGDSAIKPQLFGDAQERRRFLKNIAIRMPGEPLLWFCYHYFVRLAFLEGRRGLIASQIRAAYISQSRAKLFELQLREEL